MRSAKQFRRVLIVGAGLAGTATAIRLLQFAREPLQVVLIERRPEYRNAGVSYHRDGNHWHHVFNIQAGRMSAFREDVDDFVNWANHEADRADWPSDWSSFEFTESGPAPRMIYPDYLESRLRAAAREALAGVSLIQAEGEVVDLIPQYDRIQVEIDNFTAHEGGERRSHATLESDQVILATGLETKFPAFAKSVIDHPSFVRQPYSASGIERILQVRKDATVAIVGTLLSAYDSAALLLRRGHTGSIYLVSRSGLTLRTYPSDHVHRVLELPRPQLDSDTFEGQEELVQRFMAEWNKACAALAREHPEIPPTVIPERVSKSWEPYLPEILSRIPSPELRQLLDRYGSLLATLRVCAVAYTTEIVDAAMTAGGQVVPIVGTIQEIRSNDAGRLILSTVEGMTSQAIEADLVISNFGRESDYERVDSTLWKNLLRKKIAIPHRRTGRGVKVDGVGNLVGEVSVPSGSISVVGSPREGDEIVRNGRIGAFTFNLAAIKNHSVIAAATSLRRLETCYEEPTKNTVATLIGCANHEVDEAIARSILLEVRRLTCRRRTDRLTAATQLEGSLRQAERAAQQNGQGSANDRIIRSIVNKAAVARLVDLSMTPRDLRSTLGLDT